jgi:hypothetical protein
MANDKSQSGSNRMALDGHKPRPAPQLIAEGHKPRPSVPFSKKVQGGYQAPSGGGKPAAPTTGSGVTPKPAAPTDKK